MGALASGERAVKPERWLIGTVHGLRRDLAWAVCLAFGAGLLVILQARFLAIACHQLVIERSSFAAVLPLANWLLLVILLRGSLVLLAERRAAAVAAAVKREVRAALYRRLLQLRPAGLVGEDAGSLTETVTAGVEGLEPYVARFLPQAALALLLPLAVLVVVLPVEWRSGLVLLFSAPFIPLFMVLIGRGAEKLNRRQWRYLSQLSGYLLDRIQGLPDLRICTAVKREAAVVARVSDEYRQSTMAVLRVAFLSAFSLEFFTTVGTAVVAVIVGFRLLYGSLSLLDGLFVLLLAPEFYLPLRTLGLSYHARMQGLAAAERIIPVLALSLPDEGLGTLPAPTGMVAISFQQVSYRYGGDRGGVTGIDLELPAGSLTALVGESGSGKTTLARLLLGLAHPESGRIMVGDTDLMTISGAAWRSRLAWVPQRPFFCPGTIRDNLLLGCPEATEPEIWAALEAALLAARINRLPDGLATELGDRGAGLSGGELRRLALVRVFLRNASLVVLDEPTAGLDPETERLVTAALRRLAVNRTVLLISHRETAVRCAERVAVMSGGRIVDVVTPEAFLVREVAV